ncbi:MAG: hypothetical protein P8Y69_01290, partial [Gammaproteobacteria bacterium]
MPDRSSASSAWWTLTRLGVEAENFSELVEWAGSRCSDLVRSLELTGEPDADWSNRLWVQQQVSMLSELLTLAENHESLQRAHEFITRSLFRQVPLLLLERRSGQYQGVHEPDVIIHADSTSSAIASVVRERESRTITDGADLSVGDRQLLRRLRASEAFCIPVRLNGRTGGVMIMTTDDDVDYEFALDLYVELLGQRLTSLGAP